MISHVKHTSIPVADQDRALAFYAEKLGFKVTTDVNMGDKRWLELDLPGGNTRIVLFTMDGHEDRIGTFQPVIFATEDVQKTYDELKSKGVEFMGEPEQESWGTYVMFKDSEGNQFVLSSAD